MQNACKMPIVITLCNSNNWLVQNLSFIHLTIILIAIICKVINQLFNLACAFSREKVFSHSLSNWASCPQDAISDKRTDYDMFLTHHISFRLLKWFLGNSTVSTVFPIRINLSSISKKNLHLCYLHLHQCMVIINWGNL